MTKLRQLQDEVAALTKSNQDALAKGDAITGDEIAGIQERNPKIAALNEQIRTLIDAQEHSAQVAANEKYLSDPLTKHAHPVNSGGAQVLGIAQNPAGTVAIDNKTHQAEFGDGYDGEVGRVLKITREQAYKQAFRSIIRAKGDMGRVGADDRKMLEDARYKTLSEGVDTAGGFTVPADWVNTLIQKKPTPTRVREYVRQFTGTRDALTLPRVNYTTDNLYKTAMRVTWTGELPSSSTASRVTDPVFGQLRIPVYTAMMSLPVTYDLIEDSGFDLLGWAEGEFRSTIDLLYDNMILNGTGIGQPTGALVALTAQGVDTATQAVTLSAATAYGGVYSSSTANGSVGLSTLAYSVPEQYDENLRFVMNKTNTARLTANMVDVNGRFMWNDGYGQSGLAPNYLNRSLMGYPVVLSGFMPNVAAGAYSHLFGDLTGYYLVNRVDLSVQVITQPYAESNYLVLLGRIRFGGQIGEPWKLYYGTTS